MKKRLDQGISWAFWNSSKRHRIFEYRFIFASSYLRKLHNIVYADPFRTTVDQIFVEVYWYSAKLLSQLTDLFFSVTPIAVKFWFALILLRVRYYHLVFFGLLAISKYIILVTIYSCPIGTLTNHPDWRLPVALMSVGSHSLLSQEKITPIA